jgi:hypothetical protein
MTTELLTVKTSTPPVSDPVLDEQLEPIARKIELLQTTAILQIAREAAKIHEVLRYRRSEGGYTGYMERRLGYSSSSAYRLLDVHTVVGDGESFPNWETLPVSAVYQLCERSTPKEARDEITERLAVGEKPTCSAVSEIIAKARSKTSTPAALRDNNGKNAEQARSDAGNDTDPVKDAERRRAQNGVLFSENPPAGAASPKSKTKKPLLVEAFESRPEERATVRDLVLAEYLELASGTDILKRIRGAKRSDIVIADFLDALTVDGMRKAMSREFGEALRTAMPNLKKFKTETAVQTGRDASGKPIFTLQGRGGRSRAH